VKQECPLALVWLTWIGVPALALFMGVSLGWPAGVFVLAVGVMGQLAYVRWFPRISRWVGYGRVDDEPAQVGSPGGAAPKVTLYTASACPFCPIVRRRLVELSKLMSFELEEIDVTFRPGLVAQKGLRSVPAVEAGGRFLTGNATSAQLAEFLEEAARASRSGPRA